MADLDILPENVSVHYFATAPSDLAAVTAAELSAAVEITGTDGGEALISIGGFSTQANPVDAPNLVSKTVGRIPGRRTISDGQLGYYWVPDAMPVRDAQPIGTAGHYMLCHTKDAATGDSYHIYEAEIVNNDRDWGANNEAQKYMLVMACVTSDEGTLVA